MLDKVIKFKPSHYKAIASWYSARGLVVPPIECMSDMGYVVDGRVAGFLYLTNSNVALIEGVISNPHTVPSMRRHSLRKLGGLLVDMALSLGYTIIKVDTNHPSIEDIVSDMGFQEIKTKTFILNADEDYEEKNLAGKPVYNELFGDEE